MFTGLWIGCSTLIHHTVTPTAQQAPAITQKVIKVTFNIIISSHQLNEAEVRYASALMCEHVSLVQAGGVTVCLCSLLHLPLIHLWQIRIRLLLHLQLDNEMFFFPPHNFHFFPKYFKKCMLKVEKINCT